MRGRQGKVGYGGSDVTFPLHAQRQLATIAPQAQLVTPVLFTTILYSVQQCTCTEASSAI